MLYDEQIWPFVADQDLWIFDKLILSKRLGHLCGPAGVDVPTPNYYVVRPCVNLLGMSRDASKIWIERDTSNLPPGSFWQEVFEGRHLSVDYKNGIQIRCTEGIKSEQFGRFKKWLVVDEIPYIPSLVKDLIQKYQYSNIEMIGDKIIEVHLRGNPDFYDNPTEIVPVWCGEQIKIPEGFVFIEQPDADRIGFYKKY